METPESTSWFDSALIGVIVTQVVIIALQIGSFIHSWLMARVQNVSSIRRAIYFEAIDDIGQLVDEMMLGAESNDTAIAKVAINETNGLLKLQLIASHETISAVQKATEYFAVRSIELAFIKFDAEEAGRQWTDLCKEHSDVSSEMSEKVKALESFMPLPNDSDVSSQEIRLAASQLFQRCKELVDEDRALRPKLRELSEKYVGLQRKLINE